MKVRLLKLGSTNAPTSSGARHGTAQSVRFLRSLRKVHFAVAVAALVAFMCAEPTWAQGVAKQPAVSQAKLASQIPTEAETEAVAFAALGLPPGNAVAGEKVVATVCSACHGAKGNSTLEAVPKLAGLPANYIVVRAMQFRHGWPNDPQMSAIAKSISDDDLRNAAAYLSKQESSAVLPQNKAKVARGSAIYQEGIPSARVPACANCHGAQAAGVPPIFPRLAGQHPSYTKKMLEDFANPPVLRSPYLRVMHAVVQNMDPRDFDAIAAYVAQLSAPSSSLPLSAIK